MGQGSSKKAKDTIKGKESKERENTYSNFVNDAKKLSASTTKVINKRSPDPENEKERIQKLLSYDILDTQEEQIFDDLTELASFICGTPIALVTLVDSNRQWFKSHFGLPPRETSREAAFCSYAILNPFDVLEVEDALCDERFQQNELVLGFPNIRFYAGAPLVTPDGFPLGTLCAIDTKPRKLTESQMRSLQILSKQVVAQLEIKKYVKDLKKTVVELEQSRDALEDAKKFAEMASVSSFENLLLSPVGIAAFQEFLSVEFCAENLEFWIVAKEFKDTMQRRVEGGGGGRGRGSFGETASEEELLLVKSREIYNTFIHQGSPKQINISFDAVKTIEKLYENQKIQENMFEEARSIVFQIMKNDSYEKFLQSEQYKKLIATVRQIGFVRFKNN